MSRRGPLRWAPAIALAVSLLYAAPAGAQEAPDALAPAAATPEAMPEATPDSARPPNRLSVKARAELQARREEKEGRAPEETMALDTARLELRYERGRWLDAVLEAELADGIELADAFVRVGTRRLRTRLGQFKPPLSAIELESSWALPVLRRGIVHQTLEDHMRFAGRRPGMQVEASTGEALRATVEVGAFQGLAPGGELLRELGVLETTLAGRASLRSRSLEVGAFGALVGTEPVAGFGMGRYWTAGADAAVDVTAAGFGFRAWADALYGKSFYGRGLVGVDGMFAAGRAIGAVRWGGLAAGRPYVEAFGLAEIVRFDVDTPGSTLSGAGLGLNAGLWKRVKLGVQIEERRSGDASPPLTDGGNQLRDRRAYLVELGGSFGHSWRF